MKGCVEQSKYLLSLTEPILTRLDDSQLSVAPQPGAKTAGWLIGHLAVTGDFGCRLCGQATVCPPDWRPRFNPGTHSSGDPRDYPPVEELCRNFRVVYERLGLAVASANAAVLDAANPYVPAQAAFPRIRDFVAYLLTGHLGYHVGQLVVWRKSLERSRRMDSESSL